MHKIISKEKKPGSLVEITLELPFEAIASKKTEAIKEIGEHISIDGFRKGHVPESVLVQKVGALPILEEAADIALRSVLPEILASEKIFPLSSPRVLITKIAEGSPLEAVISIPVIPEISLPDFKKIAKKKNETKEAIEVTEEEINKVLEELKGFKRKEMNLPDDAEVELDQVFIKKIGNFETLEDFKKQLRENLTKEKEMRARENRRMDIMEGIVKETTIDLPDVLIEDELNRMTGEFSQRLSSVGHTFESYKKEIGKSDEDIRTEWRDNAKTRVTSELVLLQIAKQENIKPKEEDVLHEVKHLQEHYGSVDEMRLKGFAEEMLTKEAVFKFLEEVK